MTSEQTNPDMSALTPDVIQASQDPGAAQHHFSLGQVLATVLLGLQVGIATQSPGGLVGLLNPVEIAQIIAGFTSIWVTPPVKAAA